MEYYVAAGQQQLGPFTIEQLAAQGLHPNTLVWREGMGQWAPASALPELQHLFRAMPISQEAASPQTALSYQTPGTAIIPPFNPATSNRITAGICAIIFGQFGVHKFILGLNSSAVTMLSISLAGYAVGFSCCILLAFGPMVMGIFGLIEGIMYLCCSEEEFYMKYVVQKRQWF